MQQLVADRIPALLILCGGQDARPTILHPFCTENGKGKI